MNPRKTKSHSKNPVELHRWDDDGGSGKGHDLRRLPEDTRRASDASKTRPLETRPGPGQSVRPALQRMLNGWQCKPIFPPRRRQAVRREVFLDFDPVCPEWAIADDGEQERDDFDV